MNQYKDNLIKGLLDVFPNIGLDRAKFNLIQRMYSSFLFLLFFSFSVLFLLILNKIIDFWHTKENRRKFFETYASARKFDPLNPENWYCQQRKEIHSVRVCFVLSFNFFLYILKRKKINFYCRVLVAC